MASRYGYIVLFVHMISQWMASTNGITPQQYILEDNCDTPISFSDSMLLFVSNLTMVETCNVVLQCNSINNRLLIDFAEFDLVDNCTDTKLYVNDDLGTVIAGPLCEADLNTTVFKSGGDIVHFQYSSITPATLGKNMSVIITSFNTGFDGKCASFEFQCDNKLCISKYLVCNHINECSDNSDETLPCIQPTPTSQPDPTDSHVGIILGVTVPGSVIITIVLVIVLYRCKKRQPYQQFNNINNSENI